MKVQNSCVPTSGRRADNDLNLRQPKIKPTEPTARYDARPIPANHNGRTDYAIAKPPMPKAARLAPYPRLC